MGYVNLKTENVGGEIIFTAEEACENPIDSPQNRKLLRNVFKLCYLFAKAKAVNKSRKLKYIDFGEASRKLYDKGLN